MKQRTTNNERETKRDGLKMGWWDGNAKRCTDRTGCQNVHSAERRDRKRVSQHVDRVWVRRAID